MCGCLSVAYTNEQSLYLCVSDSRFMCSATSYRHRSSDITIVCSWCSLRQINTNKRKCCINTNPNSAAVRMEWVPLLQISSTFKWCILRRHYTPVGVFRNNVAAAVVSFQFRFVFIIVRFIYDFSVKFMFVLNKEKWYIYNNYGGFDFVIPTLG